MEVSIMKVSYVKCRRCGYKESYSIHNRYIYDKDIYIYPIIKKGWCYNCKGFRDIQIGIDISDLRKEIDLLYDEYNKLNQRVFKFGIKSKILYYKNKIVKYENIFKSLCARNSMTTCLKCGSDNVVLKEIDEDLWACPQCRIGVLELEEEIYDDIRFRTIDSIIKPSIFSYERTSDFERSLLCAMDMMKNEYLYWLYISGTPEKAIQGEILSMYALSERYVYCMARRFSRYKLLGGDFSTNAIAFLWDNLKRMYEMKIEESSFKAYLNNSVWTYSHLCKNQTNSDLESEIMYKLYHPRNLNMKSNPEYAAEYSTLFNIVNYTYNAYFIDTHRIFMEAKEMIDRMVNI